MKSPLNYDIKNTTAKADVSLGLTNAAAGSIGFNPPGLSAFLAEHLVMWSITPPAGLIITVMTRANESNELTLGFAPLYVELPFSFSSDLHTPSFRKTGFSSVFGCSLNYASISPVYIMASGAIKINRQLDKAAGQWVIPVIKHFSLTPICLKYQAGALHSLVK